MPVYEYLCRDCGDEFEKMVRFSEADINPSCPRCQSAHTTKKLSIFASLGSSSNGFDSAGSGCSSTSGFS